ncbi:lysophospholipid acyltransferase family protein [Melioribacteraceae bacterium 4301-Me]|uniref:lysophospholipid acyltransferase family protein n=1 Tax=Pyranulibacter aquaticus TaxID=3163344 RepID=UPI003594A1DC
MHIRDKIEFFLFLSLSKFFSILKLKRTRKFAKLFALFVYYCVPIRKKIVFSNLQKAFPSLSAKEISMIAKKNYFNIILTFFELMYFPYMKKEELLTLAECDELKLVIEKYNERKGLILITGHYGSWEIGAAWVGAKTNIPMYVMAKPQRNRYVTEWINKAREKFGNKVVPLGVSVREIYSVIKNGGLIGVVGDQRGPKEGLRVNFLGNETAVYSGTAQIAIKTNCPILVGLIERKADLNYKIFLYEINPLSLQGERTDDKVKMLNQKYFNLLEKHVKEHPEQWFWMHKIWKY